MVRELMLNLGYKEEEIKNIVNQYPLCNLKEETLLRKIKEIYDYLLS